MSNQAITWALSTPTGGPVNKVLLLALANYANEHNETYPSIKRLSEETDMSQATVKRHLIELADLGLITRTARGGAEVGGRQTNRYTLHIQGVRAQDEPKGLGLNLGGVRAQSEGGMGSTVSPEPEEPKEPKDRTIPLVPDRFDEFWVTYPKRTGENPKKPAKLKWDRLIKTVPPEKIIAGAKLYAAVRRNQDPTFTCQAVTWLNQARWEDDYAAPIAAQDVEDWMNR